MKAWGCDPGLRRVALACVEDGELRGSSFVRIGKENLAADLRSLKDGVVRIANEMQMQYGVPDLILVEQPSGRFNNLHLSYACGVILATLARHGFVTTYPAQSWRKVAYGSGGMRKQESKAAALTLASQLGYKGDIEDEAEAVAIAYAATMIGEVSDD